MAAYTIQQFIDRVGLGGGVSISATSPVTLQIVRDTFTTIDATPMDLGKYFTASQVSSCYALRCALVSSIAIAEAGATSLSLVG